MLASDNTPLITSRATYIASRRTRSDLQIANHTIGLGNDAFYVASEGAAMC